MLILKNVHKEYSQGEQLVKALTDVSVKFEESGLICIVGESGSGKTTLLNVLGGLDSVTSGEILYNNRNISKFTSEEYRKMHAAEIGFVFQDYNVLEKITVANNVRLALDVLQIADDEKDRLVAQTLQDVGLSEYADSLAGKLSGGQKQRVAIARAYVKRPMIILADEPTGNLDSESSKRIFELLKKLSENTLVIVVTHDCDMAKKYSDRIITLADGKITSDENVSQDKYYFTLQNGANEKKFHNIEEVESAIISQIGYEEKEYTIKVKKERIQKENRNILKAQSYEMCKLSRKARKNLIKSILTKRKVREAITIVMLAITIFLFFVAVAVISYDEKKVICNYLEQYDEKAFLVYGEVDDVLEYTDDTVIVDVSKHMKKMLSEIVGEKNVYFTKSYMELCIDENPKRDSIYTNATLMVMNSEALSKYCDIPVLNGNEIVITDYVAKELKLTDKAINELIYLNRAPVKLVAIIDTDYEEKDICHKMELNMAEEYVYENVYNVVYMGEDYIKGQINNGSCTSISFPGNYFFNSVPFFYTNQCVSFSGSNELDKSCVIGELPKAENEIVISWKCAELYLKITDEESARSALGKKYTLKDLYSEEYGLAYTIYPNLYDYCGENVYVVGIASVDDNAVDVWLNESTYKILEKEYYNVYAFDHMGVFTDDPMSVLNELDDSEYRISDPNIDKVYGIVNTMPAITKYIVALLVLMIVLTAVMFISFIGYNIKDNEKNIGIMKALGIGNEDIRKVFTFEPIVMVLLADIVSIMSLMYTIRYVNDDVATSMLYRRYDIYIPNAFWFLLVSGIVLIYSYVCVVIPIKQTNRRTIMETIRQ